jgi:hypothetical protein
MKLIIITTITLLFSHQAFADCSNQKGEDMAFYAYMEESELKQNYCLCQTLYELKTENFKKWMELKALDYAERTLNEQKLISDEMGKVERVLRKDYGLVEGVQCKEGATG